MEVVVLGVFEIKQSDDVVALLLTVEVTYLDAGLEVVVEDLVSLFECSALDI